MAEEKDIPEHVGRDLRIQRMDFGRIVDLLLLLLQQQIVRTLLDGVIVQVEGALEECRAGAGQVRARRPEPGRHVARRRRRHVIAERQRLLQQSADLLLFGARALAARAGHARAGHARRRVGVQVGAHAAAAGWRRRAAVVAHGAARRSRRTASAHVVQTASASA